MKEEIIQALKKVVFEITSEEVEIKIDIPQDPSHGDYSSNLPLVLSKRLKKNPRELAEHLKLEIGNLIHSTSSGQELEILDKVEIAGPGFLNFYISKEKLLEELKKISKDTPHPTPLPQEGEGTKGKNIMVEFTDPNPFKEFHIGHLYSNTVGESLCRLFESQGAIVKRADYFGDVGMHVAKSLWGLEKKFQEEGIDMKDLEKKDLPARIAYLGQAYAKGATAFEEDAAAQEEIKQLNKLIYVAAQQMWQIEKNLTPHIDYKKGSTINEKKLDRVYELYVSGRKWSLEYFETIYKRLGTKFDNYYPESIAGERGYTLVKEHIKDGVFVESDNAIIFPGKEQGLHNRVFINSLNLPTYEAKELGLAPWKYEEFPYDLSIIVTGNDIDEYFKVLLKALSIINPELAAKTRHISHGNVRLPEGKMSSRTGKIISGEWLINTAKEKIKEKYSDMPEETAEMVAVAAIKYALLRSSIGINIAFSFDESISFEGNSGPYLQYTFARTQSILTKSGMSNVKYQMSNTTNGFKFESEEELLLRKLIHFSEVVEDAAERFSPNIVATYLFELAQDFNLFYQKHSILSPHLSPLPQGAREGNGNEDAPEGEGYSNSIKHFRLALTAAVGNTLKNGLWLLGITAPERM